MQPGFEKSVFTSEWMTVKLRYKQPDGNISKLIEQPVKYDAKTSHSMSENYRFAAAVASFGMLLRNSEFKQHASYGNTIRLAKTAIGKDVGGYREEFLQMVQAAANIASNNNPDEQEDLRKQ